MFLWRCFCLSVSLLVFEVPAQSPDLALHCGKGTGPALPPGPWPCVPAMADQSLVSALFACESDVALSAAPGLRAEKGRPKAGENMKT